MPVSETVEGRNLTRSPVIDLDRIIVQAFRGRNGKARRPGLMFGHTTRSEPFAQPIGSNKIECCEVPMLLFTGLLNRSVVSSDVPGDGLAKISRSAE